LDDATILGLVIALIRTDLQAFLQWEAHGKSSSQSS
jgi:uncharacterized membrane protein